MADLNVLTENNSVEGFAITLDELLCKKKKKKKKENHLFWLHCVHKWLIL